MILGSGDESNDAELAEEKLAQTGRDSEVVGNSH
jgi:hypothetical protein